MEHRTQLSIGQRLEQERLFHRWTQEQVAEQLGVEPITVGRWERGRNKPHPTIHQALCTLFGKTRKELGLSDEEPDRLAGKQSCEPVSAETEEKVLVTVPVVLKENDACTAFAAADLTLRLMRLVWTGPQRHAGARCHELQALVTQELKPKENIMLESPVNRRHALRRLALFPIEVWGLSSALPILLHAPEEFLSHCAAGITACWHLRKGKDLSFAFAAVSRYVPTLEEIVRYGKERQRQEATALLAQCLILQAVLAKHVTNSGDGIRYALEAATYSEASANPLLHIRALGTQASVFAYANQWPQALSAATQAKHVMDLALQEDKDSIPPLAQSFVYVHLAANLAYVGQKQNALKSLGNAHTTLFAQSPNEAVPFYHNHSEANLVLYDGMTHAYLDLQKEAFDSFQQIQALDMKSETIRVEALIRQASAEASREDKEPDMDLCIDLWTQGVKGAKSLGSQQRFQEAMLVYATMSGIWRKEQAVKDLRGLLAWPDPKKSQQD